MTCQMWSSPGMFLSRNPTMTTKAMVQPPRPPGVFSGGASTEGQKGCNTMNNGVFWEPHPSSNATTIAAEPPKPSRRALQRHRKKVGKGRDASRNLSQLGPQGNEESTSPFAKAMRGFCQSGLAEAWAKAEIEFQVQELVWQSMPRRDAAGLNVLTENGPEAQAHFQIKSLLQTGANNPTVAIQSLIDSDWFHTVLTHAMSQSIIDLAEAENCASHFSTIPPRVLETGCIADTAVQNNNFVEQEEIHASAMLVGKTHDAKSDNVTNATLSCQSSRNRITLPTWRTKVKNTFLDLHSSDTDGSDSRSQSQGSSVRSFSAPSRSKISSRASSSDEDTICRIVTHSSFNAG